MILTAILLVALLVIISFIVLGLGIAGGVGIVLFSDVIVCAVILAWIIKKCIFKK